MDKITIAKYAAKLAVAGTISSALNRTLVANSDFARNHTVTTDVATGTAGWVASEKLAPHTNKLVDDAFAWLDARKKNANKK